MKTELEKVIADICKDLFSVNTTVSLSRPDEQFGDFSTNIALQLAKDVGQNPREIAEAITVLLQEKELIDSASVAGPGFINIHLDDQALLKLLTIKSRHGSNIKIVIETNNPNPFKAMHIGHAYNSITADTIANLLDVSGAEVHRVSYHGDVGAHVGKSMYSILKWLDGDLAKLDTIKPEERNQFMNEHYALGATSYKEDEQARAEIQKLSEQSFTLDDPVYKKVYETCKAWSFEELESNLGKLGNKPIEKRYLESQADKLGVETVKKNVGNVFIESDGALIFPGEKYGSFDNAFVSSKGRGLYGARDLGLIQLKAQDYSPDKSYIVTAEEQKDYFIGVLKAAELSLKDIKTQTTNISTGTIKLSTGKMSSRSGDVLDIEWLFEQIENALKESGNISTHILTGAIRFEFLKVRIGGDVVFDVAESVSLKGRSGPYLQYAHARAKSILRKSDKNPIANIENLEKGERSLVKKLGEYSEVVDRAVEELLPHHICVYLYELAQSFNSFYESNRVIGDEREEIRVTLVDSYAKILKSGLEILNIHAPEKM